MELLAALLLDKRRSALPDLHGGLRYLDDLGGRGTTPFEDLLELVLVELVLQLLNFEVHRHHHRLGFLFVHREVQLPHQLAGEVADLGLQVQLRLVSWFR